MVENQLYTGLEHDLWFTWNMLFSVAVTAQDINRLKHPSTMHIICFIISVTNNNFSSWFACVIFNSGVGKWRDTRKQYVHYSLKFLFCFDMIPINTDRVIQILQNLNAIQMTCLVRYYCVSKIYTAYSIYGTVQPKFGEYNTNS